MKQPSLLDRPPADPAATGKAMRQVERNADPDFKATAYAALERLARQQAEITTDDVWAAIALTVVHTHNLKAIGPVMDRGKRAGLITQTDRVKPSKLGAGRWKVTVWRSLVCSV